MNRRPTPPPGLRWFLRWLLIAILTGIVLLHAYPDISEFLRVDACLDAGGRWNEIALECAHE